MEVYEMPDGWGARNHQMHIAVHGKSREEAIAALRVAEHRAKELLRAAYEREKRERGDARDC